MIDENKSTKHEVNKLCTSRSHYSIHKTLYLLLSQRAVVLTSRLQVDRVMSAITKESVASSL